MDATILNIETVTRYNELLGVETLNPLVSVIDFAKAGLMRHTRRTSGFYGVFFKEEKDCDMLYGRQRYDYRAVSVVAVAPGQIIDTRGAAEVFQPKGRALVFHPDLIRGTALGRNMKEYTFFSYEANEALYLSEEERDLCIDCLEKIRRELQQPADRLSRRLVVNYIEVLLNYCLRFYERRSAARSETNKDILVRFDRLLDDYFTGEKAGQNGLPTVRQCASRLCLSPNYSGDLIRQATGKTAQEYIHFRLIDIAKERVLDTGKSLGEIAYSLGFQSPSHFTRLFKKLVGQTPGEYRKS